MKQNKIFCDLCGKEIEVEKDGGIALFENVTVEKSMTLNAMMNMQKREPQLHKKEYDICEPCAKKLEEYFETLKKANQK